MSVKGNSKSSGFKTLALESFEHVSDVGHIEKT